MTCARTWEHRGSDERERDRVCQAAVRPVRRHQARARQGRVSYDLVDITEDDDARAKVQALGYVQAPVVITTEEHWGGFRPDKIKELAPRRRSRTADGTP